MSFHNLSKLLFVGLVILSMIALGIIATTDGQTWFAIVIAALHCLDSVSELVFFCKFSKENKDEKQKAEQERLERLKYFN